MNYIITGSSGFIGFHLAKRLLENGNLVVGIDIENDYYDVNIKMRRRHILESFPQFVFKKVALEDYGALEKIFAEYKIDKVCHLAGQAGVRYSLKNPRAYINSNLIGFFNIIELSKQFQIQNFVFASSSSVYGKNIKQPFSTEDRVDTPISLYAATKKSNELIAHSYAHLFGLPTIGLRFFTVYGPYGRPDMAMMIFLDKISKGEAIDVYNYGKMQRDFTYIDDIIDGVVLALDASFSYEIMNLGNDSPVELEYMISLLEKNLEKQAIKNYMEIQPGDVLATWADIDHTKDLLGWSPKVSIEEGVQKTTQWFGEYFTK